jgi:hypothetical protein
MCSITGSDALSTTETFRYVPQQALELAQQKDGKLSAENQDITVQTMAFWIRRIGRPIFEEDAREIIANLSGLFKTPMRWQAESTEGEIPTVIVSLNLCLLAPLK